MIERLPGLRAVPELDAHPARRQRHAVDQRRVQQHDQEALQRPREPPERVHGQGVPG